MEPSTHTRDDTVNDVARLALIGFIVVGAFVGYEWFMSGLAKIVRGGFPSGLADELREKSEGTVGWYKSFLDGTVIPNGRTFGVLIEFGELAIGVALIAAAVILLRWSRLNYGWTIALLTVVVVASISGIFMNINFHLANGSSHPWLVPKDGFDEGVDLDSLMPLVQLVFLVVSAKLIVALRRNRAAEHAVPKPPVPAQRASVAS